MALTDQWGLTGGPRYYHYKEDRILNFNGVFSAPTPPEGVPGEVDADGVSPRGILSFKLNEDTQFNAQFSKGFRLGGINDPINLPLCSPADRVEFGGQGNWKDETSKNYEIGGKFRFLDRTVTLNVSAFYTDIQNLQATVTAGTCSSRLVFNVPAQSHGIEAELFARPNSTWDFGLSATWVDASLKGSVTSTSATGVVTVIGGLADGNRLPTAPQIQAVAALAIRCRCRTRKDFFSCSRCNTSDPRTRSSNEEPGWGQISGTAATRMRSIDPVWGSPGEYRDFLRRAASRVFARQSARGCQDRSLGGGGLPQQSLGHERAPRTRLRARPQRARGLPDESAANDRGRRTVQILICKWRGACKRPAPRQANTVTSIAAIPSGQT